MQEENLSIRFRRDLRFRDIVNIGIGAMTGATIYVMAGTATEIAGPAILIALVLNYIITILTGMTYAELSTVFPEAGGGYLFVEESLPKPLGFMGGWMSWFSHSIADAFYTVVFATSIIWLLSAYNIIVPINSFIFERAIALSILLIFILINYWGTSTTGKSQSFINHLQLILLSIFIIAGVFAIVKAPNVLSNFQPFEMDPMGIILAMGVLFVAFEGYEIIAQSAEEIENPEKNIPRAIFLSVGIVTIIYILIFFVMIGGAGWTWVADQGEFAMINFGGVTIPYIGKGIVLIAMLLGSGATLNATVYSAIRVSFAMGRNGSLPKSFSKMHPKHRTPHIATFVTGGIIAVMVLFLPLDTLVAGASIMFLLLFALVNIAVIVDRYRNPTRKRGYVIPLFPIIPIIAILSKVFIAVVLWLFSPEAWIIAIVWIDLGLLIYYFWAGKKEIERPGPLLTPAEKIEEKKENVMLVPLADEFPNSVKIASIIANNMDADVTLFSAIEIPLTISPSSITYNDASEKIKMMERMSKLAKKFGKTPGVSIIASHDPVSAIQDEVRKKNVNILFMTWRQKNVRRIIFGSTLEKIYRNAPCDILIFRDSLPEEIDEITLIVSKKRSDELSLKIAIILARFFNAKIKLYEFTYNGKKSVLMENYEELLRNENVEFTTFVMVSRNFLSNIIEISKKSKLLITPPPSEFVEGRIPPSADPRILGRLNGPVLIVRKVSNEKETMERLSMLFHR